MEPAHLRFGGGAAETVLHPLVALMMVLAIGLILCLPRKYSIIPFLLGVFFIPIGQVVLLAGVHFTVLRILIIAGLGRWALLRRSRSGSGSSGDLNNIDRLVISWALITLAMSSIQFMDAQAFVTFLGNALDALGGYVVVRFLIQDIDDVRRAIKVFATITVVMGCFMVNEQITHLNVFGLLGGVPLSPQIRDGKLRSQGAFDVYIDAGEFAAVLLPLFIWLWSEGRSKMAAVLGSVGAITMILACNSSTPLLAWAGGIVALCFWPFRSRMRIFRWALGLTLLALHLTMNGPVWSLIARVDLTGSSSGYHRYYLVDNCIRHFSDWWLMGYKDYGNWGWDMWDLSDEYVAVALTGGLAALVVFIKILSRSFAAIGNARERIAGDRKREWFLWSLGAALLGNVVGWFGCSYMAKMDILLFAILAMISTATLETMNPLSSEPPAATLVPSATGWEAVHEFE